MNYLITDLDVWEIVDRDFALERMNGMKPIPLRWVDINKETTKECRSRLVVMETKRRSTIVPEDKGAVFSATPPLEAVRMLASLAMSIKGPITQDDPDNDIVTGFLDISRAHPDVVKSMREQTRLYNESVQLERGTRWGLIAGLQKQGTAVGAAKTWIAPPASW